MALKDILPDLYDYKIVDQSFVSPTNFSCTLRIRITGKSEFDLWLQSFQKNTNTSWNLRCSSLKEGKYHFNRKFICQHSIYRKQNTTNFISRKNQNCEATLNVIIKKNTTYTRYKDKYVKEGLLGIIKINFNHSHEIDVAEVWNWLKRSDDTVQTFIEYFNNGLTPAAAKMYHEELLLLINNPEKIANSRVNPPKRWVYLLHERWMKGNYENLRNVTGFSEVLTEKAEAFKEMGCSIEVNIEPFFIVIITPLMRRQLQSLSFNISVFVDSFASCDATNSLTLLLVATKAGAIPIGAAIHSSQSEESYQRVFATMNNLWNEIVPLHIENFMTVDSTELKNGLRCVFPETPLLLCMSHVLQSIWKWLLNTENGIQQEHRKILINLFKSLMNAIDDVEFKRVLDEISSNEICLSYPNFITYLEYYLNRKNEWRLADRIHIQNMQHNTNNYAEATFRILKDIVLNRLKAYNAIALLDYLVKVMDNYYSKRLLDIAYHRQKNPYLLYDKCKNKAENILKECEVKRFKDFFLVQSETDKSIYYEVDIGLCSCKAAIQGAFCKHQCAVLIKFGLVFPNAPSLSVAERERLFEIAVGTQITLPNFLNNMNINETENVANKEINSQNTNESDIDAVKGQATEVEEFRAEINTPVADQLQEDMGSPGISGLQGKAVIKEFKDEMERLVKIVENNFTDENLIILTKKFVNKCKSISSSMQFSSFLANSVSKNKTSNGKKIKVQPTSIARRKFFSSRGSARKKYGRPVKGSA